MTPAIRRHTSAATPGQLIRAVRFTMLCLALSGCTIISYRVVPDPAANRPPDLRTDLRLFYRIHGNDPAAEEVRLAIKKVRLQVDDNPTESDSGILCDVATTKRPFAGDLSTWETVSFWSLGLIPSYNSDRGVELLYTFYVHGKLIGTYRYTVIVTWLNSTIVFIPFFWLNSVMDRENDSVAAATYQAFTEFAKDWASAGSDARSVQ